MKKIVTIAAAALVCVCVPAYSATFTLVPGSPITAGGTFDVAVELGNGFAGFTNDSITSLGFDVSVGDSTVVSYIGFDAGPLFFDGTFGPEPNVLVFANDPAGLTPSSTGYTDPFEVALLHFNALQPGTTSINIASDSANDPNQGLYYSPLNIADPLPPAVDFSAGTRVSVVSATPEPATFLLFGVGVLSLGALRRRG